MSSFRLRTLARASLAVLCASSFPLAASEPASQDAAIPTSPGQTVTVEWTGIVPAGASGQGSICTGAGVGEDLHSINLTVPDGAYDAVVVEAVFRIEWDDPAQDLVLSVYDETSELGSSDNVGGESSFEEVTAQNPVAGRIDAISCPWLADTDTPYRGRLVMTAATKPAAGTVSPSLPPPRPGEPRYRQEQSPAGIGDALGGEMNVGFNPMTGRYMLLADLQTMRLTLAEDLEDPVEPPLKLPASCPSLWEDVSFPPTTANTNDPILSTDPQTGRTFVSQLQATGTGESIYAFTDDDGATWTSGTQTNNGAADHQSMVSGPYVTGQSGSGDYPNVVTYCSQSLPNGLINCLRSDDGGLTFGAPIVAAFDQLDCPDGRQFIHGHIRYAPDGTIYVPVNNCNGTQAIMVSEDSGQDYVMRPNPFATPPNGLMHSAIAPSLDGSTLYHCYVNDVGEVHVSVSTDKGLSWIRDTNVSAPAGLAQGVFVAAVAGDPNRAACGFLGTTTPGNYVALDFQGIWFGYMATTYDGGQTWRTIVTTPNNPVQGVGGVCTAGTDDCLTANRNLLDFNEMVMDDRGMPMYAYDDGCTGACDADPINAVNYVAEAAYARQIGGRGLIAAFDVAEPAAPGRSCLDGSRNRQAALLRWPAPDHGGRPIASYQIYRGTSLGSLALIGKTANAAGYVDLTADRTAAYYYKVKAVNGSGEGQFSNALFLEPSDAPPELLCEVPGLTQALDPPGDMVQAPPEFEGQYDIESVRVAEPNTGPFAELVVFTLKVRGFPGGTVPSGTRWVIRFNGPTPPPEGQEDFFIAMTTENSATPEFVYGTTGVVSDPVVGAGARVFTVEGDLAEGSTFLEDGSIILAFAKDNPLFGPLSPGSQISKAFASIRAPATPQNNAIYDQGDTFNYVLRGPDACEILVPNSYSVFGGTFSSAGLLGLLLLGAARRRRRPG